MVSDPFEIAVEMWVSGEEDRRSRYGAPGVPACRVRHAWPMTYSEN